MLEFEVAITSKCQIFVEINSKYYGKIKVESVWIIIDLPPLYFQSHNVMQCLVLFIGQLI